MVCGLDCDWPRPKTIKLGLGQAKSVVKVADNCLSRPLTGLAVHSVNQTAYMIFQLDSCAEIKRYKRTE